MFSTLQIIDPDLEQRLKRHNPDTRTFKEYDKSMIEIQRVQKLKEQISERFLSEEGNIELDANLDLLALVDKKVEKDLQDYKNVQMSLAREPSPLDLFTYYSGRIYCR